MVFGGGWGWVGIDDFDVVVEFFGGVLCVFGSCVEEVIVEWFDDKCDFFGGRCWFGY